MSYTMLNYSGISKDYINSEYEYNFKDVITSIKEIPKKLKEYINSLKTHTINREKSQESMMEFMYPYMVDDMFRKSESIAEFLNEKNLSNEYYSFLEIIKMMRIIFKKNIQDNEKNELKFLDNVLEEFVKHIDQLFNLCSSIDDLKKLYKSKNEKYESSYKRFEKKFFEYKLTFYTEIATPNEEYEDIVKKIYNSTNL